MKGSKAMGEPKYPDVVVQLGGKISLHPIATVRRVQRALETAGIGPDEVSAFAKEATSGDYRHLTATIRRWVTVQE